MEIHSLQSFVSFYSSLVGEPDLVPHDPLQEKEKEGAGSLGYR